MALVYCDGFDTYTSAQIIRRYPLPQYGGFGTIGSPGSDGTGQCISVFDNQGFLVSLPSTYSELYVGFDFRTTQANTGRDFFRIQTSGGSDICLFVDTSVVASTYGNSGTGFVSNQWYQMQFYLKISATVGVLTVKVDGVPVINLTGLNTGTTNIGRLLFGTSYHAIFGQSFDFDNFWVFSTAGSHSNGFPTGRMKVQTMKPLSDGSHTDFTPLTGTTHYSMVNETFSNDDTSYNFDLAAGGKDSYNVGTLATSGISQVHGIQSLAVMRKDDVNTKTMALFVSSGSAEQDSGTLAVPLTYTSAWFISTDDPNTSAQWTVTAVNAMQIGVTVIS